MENPPGGQPLDIMPIERDEPGVGKLRRAFLPRIMSETAIQWKRELKKSLDPSNVFGAGNQGLDG